MRYILYLIICILIFITGWTSGNIFNSRYAKKDEVPETIEPTTIPRPLDVYSIEYLKYADIKGGVFTFSEQTEEEDQVYYDFLFTFNPNPNINYKKSTSGRINIPNNNDLTKKYPLILMIRGYIDQELYQTGMGTKNASYEFVKKGFITIAPDFLGYAKSDPESANIYETRFQTYTTALSLIESLKDIEEWNKKDIFIWGHSNGGHIALSILEMTDKIIPTSLWAPVSKPFPYSVLYYTDLSDDRGKLIRNELAAFEKLYDVEKYSFDNYITHISSPIQIQQGGYDISVPISWSNSLVTMLKNSEVTVQYHTYPTADHNLRPNWSDAIKKDIEFYNSFKKTPSASSGMN